MNKDDQKLIFKAIGGNHILQPQNEISAKVQKALFDLLENKQEEIINNYDHLSDDEKFKITNALSGFFVEVLMNGDQASFKILLGTGKGLINKQELKNIKNDFKIAKKKRILGEYRTFLLLDLLPHSNRRADAIIVSNGYKIELYDFSEGKVAEKIKNYQGDTKDLNDSEKKQLNRKNKQQERISSFHDKISMSANFLKDVVVDNDNLNV